MNTGPYTVAVTQVNAKGSESLERTLPDVFIPEALPKSINGPGEVESDRVTIPGTNFTFKAKVMIQKGTGIPGHKVRLYAGGKLIAEETIGPDGTYTIKTPYQKSGAYNITLTQVDETGKYDSPPLELGTLNVPPIEPEIIKEAAPVPGTTGVGVTGTGIPGSLIRLYANGTYVGQAVVSPNGTYSVVSGDLPKGYYVLTTTQEDTPGYESPPSPAGVITVTEKTTTQSRTITLPRTQTKTSTSETWVIWWSGYREFDRG